MVADIEHTARSAELIARMVETPREELLVRESAQYYDAHQARQVRRPSAGVRVTLIRKPPLSIKPNSGAPNDQERDTQRFSDLIFSS